ESRAHRGNRRTAHERHIAQRHQVAVGFTRGAGRAREARSHALGGVFAHRHLAAFYLELRGKLVGARLGDGNDPVEFGLQMARRLHDDGYAVRQRVLQLVGTEALRGSRGKQEPDDVLQVVVLTSQAEGSKRRSGLAAQLGSITPWRTAVISARIATAISGGVFEPM